MLIDGAALAARPFDLKLDCASAFLKDQSFSLLLISPSVGH
jgi:hypothetical protein